MVLHLYALLAGKDLLDQAALDVRRDIFVQTAALVYAVLEALARIANHDVQGFILLENKRAFVVGDAHVVNDCFLRNILSYNSSLRVYYLQIQHTSPGEMEW